MAELELVFYFTVYIVSLGWPLFLFFCQWFTIFESKSLSSQQNSKLSIHVMGGGGSKKYWEKLNLCVTCIMPYILWSISELTFATRSTRTIAHAVEYTLLVTTIYVCNYNVLHTKAHQCPCLLCHYQNPPPPPSPITASLPLKSIGCQAVNPMLLW